MEKITHLEALLFTAVLENCVDQLSILGCITPISSEDTTDISHTGSQQMKDIIGTQKELDINYQELMSIRQGSGEMVTSTSQESIEHKQQRGKNEDVKSTHYLPNRAMKHSALSVENLRKIQADRQYASDVITVTMKEMQETGTFNSLTEANEREKAKNSKFHKFLIREEEGKEEIKSLEKQLQDVKKETKIELQVQAGISTRSHKKVLGSLAHLKRIYTNVCSTGNKQEELVAMMQQEDFDIVPITEMWWDASYDWSATTDGYKLFRRD
ncbi:PREDICTED: IQ domain-containing protein G-like, partial [Apaloderma vittatum]|uniref:IQ domain-containing protein G-like n=1 Tax=Apaloderma vittatum TaxID=57397 RepID=UPI0005219690